MIRNILVMGAGSAGLIAALTLQRKMPQTTVRILRSPDIGVIGVGESTTPNVPFHLFGHLGISPRRFFDVAEPTFKLGIRFLWGPREAFNYCFEPQLDARHPELPRPNGYYCDADFSGASLQSALMQAGKAFSVQANGGGPEMPVNHAFHIENAKFVALLEETAKERGIVFIDGKMTSAERGPEGIAAINLEDGRRLTADLYIDASGFRSELLGKVMQEPFISYADALFNDRALLSTWERTDEPILPYTTAETMDAGWAWRIEHEKCINRGYVYCSAHISDEDARRELQRKNPKTRVLDRIIKFRSGRYQRAWVDNVMAVGNSCGFVEPLEATALMVMCWQCQTFADLLFHVGPTPGVHALFNESCAATWDEIRDFLALHFWANTRDNTPYWEHCRRDTNMEPMQPMLEFYRENGPTGFARYYLKNTGSQFGIEGFLAILVGCKVPHRAVHTPTPDEWRIYNARRTTYEAIAQKSLTVAQSLAFIRHPSWRWFSETQGAR